MTRIPANCPDPVWASEVGAQAGRPVLGGGAGPVPAGARVVVAPRHFEIGARAISPKMLDGR